MLKYISIVIIAIYSINLLSCKNTNAYGTYAKELDSLQTVLQESVNYFKTIDSAECLNAYSKEITYIAFINTNLKDTVTKTEAENLQQFQLLEKGLKEYVVYRTTWLNNANTSISQLSRLSHDLKNRSINDEDVIKFISEEKKHAENCIQILKVNTESIRKHLELYHQTLPVCEDFIKKINAGMLPELISPTIQI